MLYVNNSLVGSTKAKKGNGVMPAPKRNCQKSEPKKSNEKSEWARCTDFLFSFAFFKKI
jgi:hypothetical protein